MLGYLPVLPAGHAGELTNDADGVIGGLQQMGYVLQTITGDEVGRGLSCTLTKSGIDIGVVGAEQTGQRFMVGIGIGIDI